MANKSNDKVAPEDQIQGALNKTEMFFQKNGKTLLIALVAILVIVGGFFAYRYFYLVPRQERAAEMMYVAEQQFAEGNYLAALEGDGSNAGFIEIVDNYGTSRHAKLAAHYAGICYLNTGDYESALEYLKKYAPTKGAPNAIVNSQNFGLQGDIYVHNGDYAGAASMYRKAVDASSNVLTTPYYLRKLAMVCEQTGDVKAAIEACERIKTDYSGSLEARDIDKYIGYLQQK